MHSGGKTVRLQAGQYRADIVTVGAGLAALTHNKRHIVLPHKPEEMPLAHLGKVLAPWPNRVSRGCYPYHGKVFQLAVNDLITNSAIHGLVAWLDWQISRQSSSEVTLTLFLPPSYGYPFALLMEVTYWLDATSGLHALICARNTGQETAPYGAGAHPYLTCDLQCIDQCDLTLPAFEPVDPELNFDTARLMGQTTIDRAFKAASSNTEWEIRMASKTQNMAVYLRSNQPWFQIYTGEKLARRGLAVEPMSCPPDAFNTQNSLVHLAPGERHQLHYVIGCE